MSTPNSLFQVQAPNPNPKTQNIFQIDGVELPDLCPQGVDAKWTFSRASSVRLKTVGDTESQALSDRNCGEGATKCVPSTENGKCPVTQLWSSFFS